MVQTKFSVSSPIEGISATVLETDYNGIVSVLEATMTSILESNSPGWDCKIVSIGGIEVDKGRNTMDRIIGQRTNSVEVIYEFIKEIDCESTDECSSDEESAAISDGQSALSSVRDSIESGEFEEKIVSYANAAGLSELINGSVVEELTTTIEPETEVLAISAYPSIRTTSSPTTSPSFSTCKDSLLRFVAKKDGLTIRRSCAWVSVHPNDRCSLEGVRTHCPRSCWACELAAANMISGHVSRVETSKKVSIDANTLL